MENVTNYKYPVIGLYSPAPQSGKSTVSSMLMSYINSDVGIDSFAAPIKAMIKTFIECAGYTEESAWMAVTNPEYKETTLGELGITPRYLMQTLGTEWGRNIIDRDIWTKLMKLRLTKDLHQEVVIIDDVRFQNEYSLISSFEKNKIIKVIRPGVEYSGTHTSEGNLDFEEFDYTILNDGSLHDLREKVAAIAKEITDEYVL